MVEAFVVIACVYGLALRITWPYAIGGHPHVLAVYEVLSSMLVPMFWSFLLALVFLLLGSPFLLGSLRSVAIRAWIIGVVAFFCAGFLYFGFR